jgi:hypothetical protein
MSIRSERFHDRASECDELDLTPGLRIPYFVIGKARFVCNPKTHRPGQWRSQTQIAMQATVRGSRYAAVAVETCARLAEMSGQGQRRLDIAVFLWCGRRTGDEVPETG